MEADAWFEQAVDCCAFLTYRLGLRGIEVRLRTQELDMRVPEEGDIYALLKYLAWSRRCAEDPLPRRTTQRVFRSCCPRARPDGSAGLGPRRRTGRAHTRSRENGTLAGC